jgi:hypothetical protein
MGVAACVLVHGLAGVPADAESAEGMGGSVSPLSQYTIRETADHGVRRQDWGGGVGLMQENSP